MVNLAMGRQVWAVVDVASIANDGIGAKGGVRFDPSHGWRST